MKALFADREFNAKHRLGAVNSINWARIVAQTVYYFLAYFQLIKSLPSDQVGIQFVVPTGNFGDILAGYYAKRMGLPVSNLVVATNENDILYRFWKTGKYEKVASSSEPSATLPVSGSSDGQQATEAGGVKETHSPAMDIGVSSNFERLLWYLAFATRHEDTEQSRVAEASKLVDGWMESVKTDGRAEVPVSVLEQARADFSAERVSDPQVCFCPERSYSPLTHGFQTLEAIQRYYSKYQYVTDPHTAVGLAASDRLDDDK